MSQSNLDSRTVRRVGIAACVVAGLGCALRRARTVPSWAAVMFVAAPVVHVMSVMASARALDIVAFAGLTIAAGAVARAIVATPDRDWELAPDHPQNRMPRLTTAAK